MQTLLSVTRAISLVALSNCCRNNLVARYLKKIEYANEREQEMYLVPGAFDINEFKGFNLCEHHNFDPTERKRAPSNIISSERKLWLCSVTDLFEASFYRAIKLSNCDKFVFDLWLLCRPEIKRIKSRSSASSVRRSFQSERKSRN